MSDKKLEDKASKFNEANAAWFKKHQQVILENDDEFIGHTALHFFRVGAKAAQADMLAESAKTFDEWWVKHFHTDPPLKTSIFSQDIIQAWQAASLAKDAQHKAEIEAKDKRIAELESFVKDVFEDCHYGSGKQKPANQIGVAVRDITLKIHQDLIESINQRGEE